MKKFISLIILLILCFTFVGCGWGGTDSSTSIISSASQATSNPASSISDISMSASSNSQLAIEEEFLAYWEPFVRELITSFYDYDLDNLEYGNMYYCDIIFKESESGLENVTDSTIGMYAYLNITTEEQLGISNLSIWIFKIGNDTDKTIIANEYLPHNKSTKFVIEHKNVVIGVGDLSGFPLDEELLKTTTEDILSNY